MHVYQDISHFRAPYKSLQSVAGFGAEAAAAAAPAITMDQINAVTVVGADGIRRYKPEVAGFLLEMLKSWHAIHITNELVNLEPYPQALLDMAKAGDAGAQATITATSARGWIDRKVAEGNAVFVPYAVLWPSAPALAAGIQAFATPYGDKQTMRTAGSALLGAYAAEPGGAAAQAAAAAGWGRPMLIALGVAAGVGLLVVAYTRVAKPRRRLTGSLGARAAA